MGVRHSTKFVLCLGGSVKDINTVWWPRLRVAAATVLVSMTQINMSRVFWMRHAVR